MRLTTAFAGQPGAICYNAATGPCPEAAQPYMR